MNTRTEPHAFDSFDQALVTELRYAVAERATAPQQHRRRRPALAVAGIAAVTVGAFGFSTLGASSAYAVERTQSGDIRISIHNLSDAAGLEKTLASFGIDAKVNYQAGPSGISIQPCGVALGSSGGSSSSGSSSVGSLPANSPCGDPTHPPLTTDLRSGDYVITIPKGSALTHADSQLDITTNGKISDSVAGLSVDYKIDGTQCGFGTVSASAGAVAP